MIKVLMGSSVALCLLLGGCGSEVGEGIWNADSVEIEVSHFSFFEGGYRWRKLASQFTSEQAQLVGELKLVEATESSIEDAPEGKVIVTAENDARTEYRFAYEDTSGSSQVLVEYAGVTALLGTVSCLSAKGYSGSDTEEPPKVAPDDGCLHGVFSSAAADDSWLYALEVEPGETYQVTVEDCRERELKLTVVGADDEVVASVSEELGTCPTLSFVAPETGPTLLRMEKFASNQAGDFYFSLRSVD